MAQSRSRKGGQAGDIGAVAHMTSRTNLFPVFLIFVYANVQSVRPETSRVGTGDFESPCSRNSVTQPIPEENHMNSIIYIVGLVVIVMVVLSFLGLR